MVETHLLKKILLMGGLIKTHLKNDTLYSAKNSYKLHKYKGVAGIVIKTGLLSNRLGYLIVYHMISEFIYEYNRWKQ